MSKHPASLCSETVDIQRRKQRWLGALVIVAACFVVYAPALDGTLVWDDDTHLLDNPVFDENGLYKVWFEPLERLSYWPVTFTSHWLEYQLWEFEPRGYHVVNVLLHALSALVLWGVLRAMALPLPWLVALVFAIHPVNVESVAWISQRKNLLSMLFFIISALFYLRFEAQRKASLYAMAIVSFTLAMLSKGAAAPYPALLLLMAWWQRGTITRKDIGLAIPFFLIAGITSFLEIAAQVLVADGVIVRDDGFVERLAGAGWVVWFYLLKLLVPIGLNFVYPRWEIDASSLVTWLPLAAGAALLAVTWWYRQSWGRPVLAALLFYVLMLSPVLGFFDIYYMRYSLVADHYQYIAMISILALVVGGLGSKLYENASISRGLKLATAGVLVLGCGATSASLSSNYKSSEILWRETIAKNPDAFLAHYNFAWDLQHEGRLDEAVVHYRETLRIQPDNAQASNNLGRILQDQGHVAEAFEAYRHATASDPNNIAPRNNLAFMLQKRGDLPAAQAQFEAALEVDPESAVLHFNYAQLLTARGDREKALVHFRYAAELAPDSPQIRAGLSKALRPPPSG